MQQSIESKRLSIPNEIISLRRITRFLDELAVLWELPGPFLTTLNLVTEEAFTNIIQYGFPDGGKHNIEITFEKDGKQLRISIIDDGIPYDPTKAELPDLDKPLEERDEGGLGIFLIKQMMEKVEYRRKDEKNILVMEKTIGEE